MGSQWRSATTSPGYTTIAGGLYAWTADYSGDNNNLPASSGCTAEEVTIPERPSVSTAQDLIPNDSLTLSGATATPVDGRLLPVRSGRDLQPGERRQCGAHAAGLGLVGNLTATTNNSLFHATTEGTWTWLAIYGGDANNDPATSNCVETFTIDN